MTVEPITPELAAQLNLDRDIRGVVITGVDPSGAAASAGLREGDVIQQVNGKSVRVGRRRPRRAQRDVGQAGGAVDHPRRGDDLRPAPRQVSEKGNRFTFSAMLRLSVCVKMEQVPFCVSTSN